MIPLFQRILRFGRRAISNDTPAEEREEARQRLAGSPQLERINAEAAADFRRLEEEDAALARSNAQTEFKATDGIGVLQARIPGERFMEMRAKYGDDCWNDNAFMEGFLRDNPQYRVRTTRGTRGQQYVRDPHRP